MSWKTEHGADFDVPALIDFMVKKEMLEDVSWHNDTMPRFDITDPDDDENRVILWVDHVVASEREAGPGGKRFMVQAGADGSDEFDTDELEEAVAKVCEFAEKYIPGDHPLHPPGIVREWVQSLRRIR